MRWSVPGTAISCVAPRTKAASWAESSRLKACWTRRRREPPSGVAYTRRVTQVWCGFFVLNGALALATALWMSDRAWALYNGLIAYGLIGLLFGVEGQVRQRVTGGHRHG